MELELKLNYLLCVPSREVDEYNAFILKFLGMCQDLQAKNMSDESSGTNEEKQHPFYRTNTRNRVLPTNHASPT
jgi:hypothetical protein